MTLSNYWCSLAASECNFWLMPFWALSNGKHIFICSQLNRAIVNKWKTRCFTLHSTENMFWLVGNEIGFFELHIAKNSVFPICFLKHVALTQKTCFGLFAVKLCCFQRYCTGRRFSSSLQRDTLLFTWFYSGQRFFLCLAKWQRFC